MKTRRTPGLHRAGEADFVFPSYGGAVRLSATGDALTPFGGLRAARLPPFGTASAGRAARVS